MIDQTDFSAAFRAKLAEVELEFEQKQTEVTAARQAVEAAKDAAFAAAQRFEHFNLTVLRASRHSVSIGSDERMLSLVTGPLDALGYEELQRKQAADLALTRAQKLLANLEWQLGNLRDAAMQLRQCISPARLAAPALAVVKRPERPAVDIDDILPARGAA